MSDSINNKTLVLIGGSGFVGTCLTRKLLSLEIKVICFDRISNIEFLENESVKFYKGDVDNAKDIAEFISSLNQHDSTDYYLVHLAALKNEPESFKNPYEYININCMGTLNVLEQSRALMNLKNIVLLSTSIVKTISLDKDVAEGMPSLSPYALSKYISEKFMLMYQSIFKTPMTIVRATNIIGPGLSEKSVIPSIINQMKEKKDLTMGNLDVVRDFIYIDDMIDALIKITLSDKSHGKIIDIGTGSGSSIKELVDSLAVKLNFKNKITSTPDKQRKNEAHSLIADTNFLTNELKWQPLYNLDKSLDKIINHDGGKDDN